MKWRSRDLLIVVGVAALIAITLLFGRSFAAYTHSGFFQQRASIFAELQSRIQQEPAGTTIILPPNDESRQETIPHADESHVRRVVRQQEWNSTSTFTLLVNLDEAVLPPEEQGNSKTMAATKLLEHYFGGLGAHGLARRNGGVTAGILQMASECWASADELIFVEGTVFVAPTEKQAIVKGVIRERLP